MRPSFAAGCEQRLKAAGNLHAVESDHAGEFREAIAWECEPGSGNERLRAYRRGVPASLSADRAGITVVDRRRIFDGIGGGGGRDRRTRCFSKRSHRGGRFRKRIAYCFSFIDVRGDAAGLEFAFANGGLAKAAAVESRPTPLVRSTGHVVDTRRWQTARSAVHPQRSAGNGTHRSSKGIENAAANDDLHDRRGRRFAAVCVEPADGINPGRNAALAVLAVRGTQSQLTTSMTTKIRSRGAGPLRSLKRLKLRRFDASHQ